jgi:hypothetical protein
LRQFSCLLAVQGRLLQWWSTGLGTWCTVAGAFANVYAFSLFPRCFLFSEMSRTSTFYKEQLKIMGEAEVFELFYLIFHGQSVFFQATKDEANERTIVAEKRVVFMFLP